MKTLLAFALLLTLAPQSEDKATVYFYRLEEQNKLDSRKVGVMLDGKRILEMPEENFVGLKIAPGKYGLRMSQKRSEMLLTLEAGKTYYVRVSQISTGFSHTQSLTMVTAEQAIFQMRDMKLLKEKNIKDGSLQAVKEKPQP